MVTFLELAKQDGDRCERLYKSWSGSDVAETEFYRSRRAYWIDRYEGKNHETAFAIFDTNWRNYCNLNNARVANAPKIKTGPSAGHSGITHRWVSPEKAANNILFLVTMSEKCKVNS